jgi:hypothetical protein
MRGSNWTYGVKSAFRILRDTKSIIPAYAILSPSGQVWIE